MSASTRDSERLLMEPTIDLVAYNGEHKDNANVVSFKERLPGIIRSSVDDIKQKIGVSPPENFHVEITLTDGLGAIPMVEPTGKSSTKMLKNGDVLTQKIELSSKLVANDGMGYTKPEKIIKHEIVHSILGYNNKRYHDHPLWMTEGVALWVSDQGEDFAKVPDAQRNKRWKRYKKYYDKFTKRIDKKGVQQTVRDMVSNEDLFGVANYFKTKGVHDVLLAIAIAYISYRIVIGFIKK